MDIEQRIILHGIQFAVELHILIGSNLRRGLAPKRCRIIDNLILVCLLIFAVFPLLLLAKCNWNRHKLAVFVQKPVNLALACKLLALIIQIKYNLSSPITLVNLLHIVLRRTVTAPFNCLCTIFPRQSPDFHLL